MKKSLFIIFFLVFSVNYSNSTLAKIENKIILKVENSIITNYEIKNKILSSLILAGDEINQKNIDKLKEQALESLIQQKLKKIELNEYKIKKNDAQVKTYLKSISSNDIFSFKKKFEDNNLDYQLFLEEVEIQLMWQELIYKIYSTKIEIDENVIDLEIDNFIKNKNNIKEFNISEIEISLNNDVSDDDKILNLEKQIKEQGFGVAAIKYSVSDSASNKGNLGWINVKLLSDQIYNNINELKIGQITKPIIQQDSVLFLKVNNIRSSKTKNMDISELKQNLINQKKNDLFNLYSRSHLSKLKNTSLIEYK